MARPKAFDSDEALLRAIALFREKGYAGTSTEELLRVMNIGRQSMYDTFGDKRGLYLAALGRYNVDSVGDFVRDMQSHSSPLRGLESALLKFAERASTTRAGCMGVGSIFEMGQGDADVAILNNTSGEAQLSAIERQLCKAQEAGEVAQSTDTKAAARFVAANLTGIKVAARSGAELTSLKDVIGFAISALKATAA